ncbi:MAG: hypothetical protein VYE03_04550, partial [Nitrospinota bacterium]|nr:hypothetical protein [Nitrospinota bacterium]
SQLEKLNLNYNQLHDSGAIELTHSNKLKRLKSIDLTYNPIEKTGKDAWKRFQLTEWLKELNRTNRLSEVGAGLIGDLGVDVLLQSPFANKLEVLDLKNNDLSDKAVIALSRSVKLEKLVSLNLSKNNITDMGAKALAQSSSFGKLKKLDLNFNSIGDEGALAIAQSQNLENLESLKLGQNKIGTEGARALNKSKTLQNLIHPIFGFY